MAAGDFRQAQHMPSNNDKSDKNSVPRPARRGRLPPNFMKYPSPTEAETARIWRNLQTAGMKEESKRCIANLLKYRAVRTRARLPRGVSAAVLVPLFVGRSGDLYVLLSRRSDALKAFAGDTALPGGKVDAHDRTVEDTARREAFEEIGLPQDAEQVPLLCVMEPHLAKNEILVTPIVVLILDRNLQPNLNSSEVTSIFAQPLISFLSSKPYMLGSRAADTKDSYHTFTDLPWSDGGAVRLHRFLTGRESEGVKPVFGLTAAILIKTATIGYGQTPDFEVQPPNAPTSAQQTAYALLTPANPLRISCEREGLDANKAAALLLRPPIAPNARRTIEREKIGAERKKLLEGDSLADVTARVDARRPGSGTRNPGGEDVHQQAGEIKKQAQAQVESGGGRSTGGQGAKIEAYQKQALQERTEENGQERGEHVEGRWDTFPNLTKSGAFLDVDETRDIVNERMKEVKGDERKLGKARKAYPMIVDQVKERMEGARGDSDGEFDRKALVASMPQEGQMKSGKEGIRRGLGEVDNGKRRDQDIARGKEGLEDTRKRDAKL